MNFMPLKRASAVTPINGEFFETIVGVMPINVMIADPDTLTITYLNRTSLETLRTVEHLLPVPADKIVGQCIDIFHKYPAHQRALLAGPSKLPHHAKISLG